MVERRVNKPVGRVQNFTLFWLHQVLTDQWTCRNCGGRQPKGSVAFEMTVKQRVNTAKIEDGKLVNGKEDSPVRLYLCLACASAMLEDARERVEVCKNLGPNAYRLMDEA